MTTPPTELEQIAAAVAESLRLDRMSPKGSWIEPFRPGHDAGEVLAKDGSNLFDPYWFQRCVLWLLKLGYRVNFGVGDFNHSAYDAAVTLRFDCPAVEFPARAIHALVSGRTST